MHYKHEKKTTAHTAHHRPCKVCALLVLSLTQLSSNVAFFLDTSGVSIPEGELGEEAPSTDTITMPLLSTTYRAFPLDGNRIRGVRLLLL